MELNLVTWLVGALLAGALGGVYLYWLRSRSRRRQTSGLGLLQRADEHHDSSDVTPEPQPPKVWGPLYKPVSLVAKQLPLLWPAWPKQEPVPVVAVDIPTKPGPVLTSCTRVAWDEVPPCPLP